MKQQPSKKAIAISAVLTAFILIGMAGVSFTKSGWSLALTNPVQTELAQTENLTSGTLDSLGAQAAADQMTALDPALEAALDAALDPDMDPALKASLKSALRSALAPQAFPALTSQGKQPPFVVTVEPIYMAGQQQVAASSGGQQWSAPAQAQAPVQAQASAPAVDQVAAAYQAQLEQAYAALQDAYTQIDTLQTAPVAAGNTNISYQGDDDHGSEREDGEHDDDDHDGGDND